MEKMLHPSLSSKPSVGTVKGGVIMAKLGNETAKCVHSVFLTSSLGSDC